MGLIPKDEKFFDLFAALATRITGSANLIHQLFSEPSRIAEYVAAIKKIEHEADQITHQVIARIDRSFVTPFDREDIHLLASQLDEVIDLLDGTARRAQMFHVHETKPAAQKLCEVLVQASASIEAAVAGIKQPRVVSQHAIEIKRLEETGDAIYHQAVGELFAGNPDPLDVIKWKELYDKLEDALDQCEDVANVLESISIKNS
jgi:uncharacterized protein